MKNEKLYTVFVGGTEVNDYHLILIDAEILADEYSDYDDVYIVEVEKWNNN